MLQPLSFRAWLAAVVMGAVAIVLFALSVRYVELVTGTYLSSGVPPIAGLSRITR